MAKPRFAASTAPSAPVSATIRRVIGGPSQVASLALAGVCFVALNWFSAAAPAADSVRSPNEQRADPQPVAGRAERDSRLVELRFDGGATKTIKELVGRDARLQLVVAGKLQDGRLEDFTRRVSYRTEPEGVVTISNSGLVTPLGDGEVTVIASAAKRTARVKLAVTGFDDDRPISFAGQVVPIFTKLGCNGGGCHGKIAGQNGFKLSLLGFEPREDYEHLVRESRGRRIFPAAPDRSLLLLKAINASPHGGGQRMDAGSHEYRLLRRWIAQGVPYGTGQEPTVTGIEIFPPQRRLAAGTTQQLSVVATYSDGSTEDVTRAAVYESNDSEMGDVTETGLVRVGELVGDVAVMARYQGHVAVFRADIPLEVEPADPSEAWPEPHNVVDEHVLAKLRSLRIPASELCDDGTFLRRVTLDIAGRLPTLAEVSEFEAYRRVDKRARWIDRLLESDDYAEYFAAKWNVILRNRRTGNSLSFGTLAFHDWIRESLRENKPFDQFVRGIVTASGSPASNPPVVWYREVSDTNQRLEDAAQLFLGQRIQCARCHHHPFEKWSQRDYAQMSAFFSQVAKKPGRDPDETRFVSKLGSPTARHPKTGQSLQPAGLDGPVMEVAADQDPRSRLVDWMVAPENPFFAKALVNRYWKHFLGRGLVEPEDDLRVTNPPSNPALLDALSEAFVASGYDLKELIRLICRSRTYQLSSQPRENNLADRRSYSRYYPKRLTAEVLLDAVDDVTGTSTTFTGMPPGTRAVALPDTGFDSYFLTVFGRPRAETACECERSQEANLAQSLHLLNSEEMQKKLSAPEGWAAAAAKDTKRTEREKLEQLFRMAFSRVPRADELETLERYLAEKESSRQAYEDVVWSVLNSKEFMFNH